MKKALITGVAGFVGSNLARELLKRNYKVIGIDNLSQGNRRNIEDLFDRRHFLFYEGDICDPGFILKMSRDVDCIFHLAAYKIPRYGNALATLRINIKGTENVLETARTYRGRVVFSSTSDIYGRNPSVPFNEENSDIVLGQTNVKRWAYAVSKIYDEQLCLAYQEEYGIDVAILRYFGGYGPYENLTWWGGPQSVFIDCAINKKPMPLHGDGKQTRTFCYISDIVEATIKAMENDNALGEVFNIGTEREIAIIDLAKMIWRMINSDNEPLLEYIPYKSFYGRYEDVRRRIPDISKAKKLLGYTAKIGLEEGLRLTIKWQREFLKKA